MGLPVPEKEFSSMLKELLHRGFVKSGLPADYTQLMSNCI
jgi:hypothetical protein